MEQTGPTTAIEISVTQGKFTLIQCIHIGINNIDNAHSQRPL